MIYVRNLGGWWYPDSKIQRAKKCCLFLEKRKKGGNEISLGPPEFRYLQSIKTDTIKKTQRVTPNGRRWRRVPCFPQGHGQTEQEQIRKIP